MKHSAEPEAEKQATGHSNQLDVVREELHWRVSEHQEEELVVDQHVQSLPVSMTQVLESVVERKEVDVEVIEEASVKVKFADQLLELVMKVD